MFHDRPRRRLRSSGVRLALLGATAFALSACDDDTVDTTAFPSLAACQEAAGESGAGFTAEDCSTAFAAAEAAHQESAPRYDDEALCEEEHGSDCVAEDRVGGSPVFLPVMAGYLLGRSLGGRTPLLSQPLYSLRGGGFTTPSGDVRLGSNAGRTSMTATSFRPAPSTVTAAPMTRATVSRTGGFGGARTSFGG